MTQAVQELPPLLVMIGAVLALIGVLVFAQHLVTALTGVAARLGIWATGRLAGEEEVYGSDRADEGRMERHGRARTALAPRGKVFVSGELWEAEAEAPVAAGERIEVISRSGLLLRVRAAAEDDARA